MRYGKKQLNRWRWAGLPPVLLDVGSQTTRWGGQRDGVALHSTCVLVDTSRQEVVGIGSDTASFLEKTPHHLKIAWPVVRGAVAEPYQLAAFLQQLAQDKRRSQPWRITDIFRTPVQLVVPSQASPVARHIWKRTLYQAGFGTPVLVGRERVLVRRWQQLYPTSPAGIMLDIGDQTTEIVVTFQHQVLQSRTIAWGSRMLTELVVRVVAQELQTAIGWQVAEKIKRELVLLPPPEANDIGDARSVSDRQRQQKLVVRGKHIEQSLPVSAMVQGGLFHQAVSTLVDQLIEEVQFFLADLPVEALTAAFEQGIFLTGGGSQLLGLSAYVGRRWQTEVTVSQTPMIDSLLGLQALQTA